MLYFENLILNRYLTITSHLKELVDPSTSTANYSDGILTVTFKLETKKSNITVE
jgi:HSP20 family molecular chaperone IbpA